jgi:Mce-associated membrane protein
MRKGTLAGILAGVTVLFTCLAVFFSVSGSPLPANTALVDVAATNAVTDQVGRAIKTVFSYDPSRLDQTAKAAQEVLTGAAMDQYNSLFTKAKDNAIATQQVLTTAVRSIGVIDMHGDAARVLVFIDRQIVQGDKHESAVAQLIVHAAKTGETWKITEIQVL